MAARLMPLIVSAMAKLRFFSKAAETTASQTTGPTSTPTSETTHHRRDPQCRAWR